MEKSEIRAEAKKRVRSLTDNQRATFDFDIRERLYEVLGFSEAARRIRVYEHRN
jgi:hypothetical protein